MRTTLFRRIGAVVAWALVIYLVVEFVRSLASNPNIHWDAVGKYLFSSAILHGVVVTIELSVVAMVAGIWLGVGLALCRQSRLRIVRVLAAAYIWFFRGSPVLVQLVFWFNLGLIFPTLSLGIPGGPTFFSVTTNSVITGFMAALLGLGLNEAAYMAEIIRSGILAVNRGQSEAARALGMPPLQVMRLVVLPQALRVAVPPTANQVINMLKVTSLVSVIGGGDVLTRAENISSQNFYVIELLVVATIWYLVLTTVATIAQSRLERRMTPGFRPRRGVPSEAVPDAAVRGLATDGLASI